ncbi:AAA family ATPase [Nocardia nova]|uniref:AAA family ATPase n=1 Tax=Nocardia nova TaxID=37330 RepID=UPI000CE9CB74|nr:AAA family ATPase [Nocardia nova]PPJ34407.1 AAA family ATPase [Nocardia nova]
MRKLILAVGEDAAQVDAVGYDDSTPADIPETARLASMVLREFEELRDETDDDEDEDEIDTAGTDSDLELFESKLFDGASFILDAPDVPAAWWGEGSKVLAARGEATMLAGVAGVGKSTIEGQLVRASLGLQSHVLNLPVQECPRVLVLAMDRPAQLQRAFQRVFGAKDREVLARLVFWKGPPLEDFAVRPEAFLELVERAGLRPGDRVFVDSLKDAAIGLSEDRVGAGYNRARQAVLAAGFDVFELHHLVKRSADGGPPKSLADLYGSTWLANGAGSVAVLIGEPGDPIVRMVHLKQPMDDCGPLTVHHDHTAGTSWVDVAEDDIVEIVRAQGNDGCTAEDAAVLLFATARPSKADQEKARRRLTAAVNRGALVKRTQGAGRGAQSRWFLAHGGPEKVTPGDGNRDFLGETAGQKVTLKGSARKSREG